MKYVIRTVEEVKRYYSFKTKQWSTAPFGATKFGKYNLLRFACLWYVRLFVLKGQVPVELYRLIQLKASVSMFGKMK